MNKIKCKVVNEKGYKSACDLYPGKVNIDDFTHYYTGTIYKYLENSESFLVIRDDTKEFIKVPIINCISLD